MEKSGQYLNNKRLYGDESNHRRLPRDQASTKAHSHNYPETKVLVSFSRQLKIFESECGL